MARRFLSIAVLFSIGTALALAQAQGFSGVWVWEPSKSSSQLARPEGLQLTVVAERSRISVTRLYITSRGSADEQYACTTDGTPSRAERGSDTVTREVRWDGQSLVWRAEQVVQAYNRTLKWTERWSLSPDGNTLTIDRAYVLSPETARTNPELGRVKEVFTRQRAPKR